MTTVNPQTVGVVIPMYNGAGTIAETLTSICAQTYPDLDIVVINDGSTDGSPTIVENWPDPRIRLVSKENGGLSSARNSGAAATSAAYLAFCDADDIWRPQKIEAQMKALADEPDALVWCWYDEIDQDGNFIRAGDMSSEETLKALCRWNIIGNGSSMLVSRRAFDASGGFDETLQSVEDYSFALQVAARFSLKVVRERLLSYRVTQGNMSSDTRKMYRSLILVLDRFNKDHPDYRDDLQVHNKVATLGFYYRALQVGDFPAARFFYGKLSELNALRSGLKRNFVIARTKAIFK